MQTLSRLSLIITITFNYILNRFRPTRVVTDITLNFDEVWQVMENLRDMFS